MTVSDRSRGGANIWSNGNYVAGRQFTYNFDDIDNRTSAAFGGDTNGSNLRSGSYTADNLNRYTSRAVPAYVEVTGSATNTATVTVNGNSTYRTNDYYWAELAVTNSSAPPVYLSVSNKAVLPPGPNGTITGNVYVPTTPENFTYDADGNLLTDGRWTYTWDAENRLITLSNNANVPDAAKMTLNFAYDYYGRRINKIVSNYVSGSFQLLSNTKFVYDGWNLVDELNGTNNAVIRGYMWGMDLSGTMQGAGGVGGLLAISGANSQFTCFDGNGNITALVDTTSSAVTGQYEYGPFGETIRITGSASGNPCRFSTKYSDVETDFLYYGYRYYNPS